MEKRVRKSQMNIDFIGGFFLFILAVVFVAYIISNQYPKYISQSSENNMRLEAWQASESFMRIADSHKLDESESFVNVDNYLTRDSNLGWNLNGVHMNTTSSDGKLHLALFYPDYSGWSHRKKIIINGSTSPLSGYAINITVDFETDMQNDFDDLRFTYVDPATGEQPVPYWIETYTAATKAIVWIKSDFKIGNNTFYMYYGDATAASISNGFDVFDVFDDFNDNALNPLWLYEEGAAQNDYFEQLQRLEFNVRGKTYAHIQRSGIPSQNFEAVTKMNFWDNDQAPDEIGPGIVIWFDQYDWTKIYMNADGANSKFSVFWDKDGTLGGVGDVGPFNLQQWYWLKIIANSTTISFYHSDDAENWNAGEIIPRDSWIIDPNSLIILGAGYERDAFGYTNPDLDNNLAGVGPHNEYFYDDVRVRKYVNPEPHVIEMSEGLEPPTRGTYLSNTVNTARIIKITPIIDKQSIPPDVILTLEVSADGGASWISAAHNQDYTSGAGIGSGGDQLRFRVNFTTNDNMKTANLTSLTINYVTSIDVSFMTCVDYNYNDILSRESHQFVKKKLNVSDLDEFNAKFDIVLFGATTSGDLSEKSGTVDYKGNEHIITIRNTSDYFDEMYDYVTSSWSSETTHLGVINQEFDISKIDPFGNYFILRKNVVRCGPTPPTHLSNAFVRRYGVYEGSFAVMDFTYW